MNQQSFFEDQFDQKEQVDDRTEITSILLYYEKSEAAQFKSLCKIGMMDFFPNDFNESNVSDFLLTFLKKYYGQQHNA